MKAQDLHVTVIDKISSPAFAEAIFAIAESGRIAFPAPVGAAEADYPGISVLDRVEVLPGGGWFARRTEPVRTQEIALIALTSGTTGTPKPILLSHRNIASTTNRLVSVMKLDASIREYVGVPVTLSFGLGRIRAIAAIGGASYVPKNGFRADEFEKMLHQDEVNALSAVPTMLRLLLAQGLPFYRSGPKLRWLEIGSQPMSAEEKAAVRNLFPNALIVQHYGLTEASRSTFLDISAAAGSALASVGSPTQDVEIKITTSGYVAIRGPHVAQQRLTDTGVISLVDEDGWLETSDLGRMIDGRLFIDGRADYLANVGGVKVPSESFEEKMRALLGESASFAVSVGADPIRGQRIVVAYEGGDVAGIDSAARDAAMAFGIGSAFSVFQVDELPTTDSGKARRSEISRMFEMLSSVKKDAELDQRAAGIAQLFIQVFGERAADETASFSSLGGDSLSYVTILTGLHESIDNLPEDWDILSIGQLASLASAASNPQMERSTNLPPQNLDTLRGIACVLVVVFHVVGSDASTGMRLPDTSWWRYAVEMLTPFRLPVFLAMAGFFYAAVPSSKSNVLDFVSVKLRQFVPPVLFVTLVLWILRGLAYGSYDSLIEGILQGYLHLWFMYALFIMFISARLIDKTAPGNWKSWIIIGIFSPILYNLMPRIEIFSIGSAIHLFCYFCLGIVLFRLPSLLDSRRFVTGCGAVAGTALCLQYLVLFHAIPDFLYSNYLTLLCGSAVVVVMLTCIPKFRFIEKLAPYSYSIYLWHPVANAGVRFALKYIGYSSGITVFVAGLVAGVVSPMILHRIVMRIPKLSLVVIGK